MEPVKDLIIEFMARKEQEELAAQTKAKNKGVKENKRTLKARLKGSFQKKSIPEKIIGARRNREDGETLFKVAWVPETTETSVQVNQT